MKKVIVNYDSNLNTFLDFIEDAKSGKYTDEKPEIVDFKYQRIEIQEQEENIEVEDYQENSYLFGITS